MPGRFERRLRRRYNFHPRYNFDVTAPRYLLGGVAAGREPADGGPERDPGPARGLGQEQAPRERTHGLALLLPEPHVLEVPREPEVPEAIRVHRVLLHVWEPQGLVLVIKVLFVNLKAPVQKTPVELN